ncbi:tRNA (guanosine(46)-N7)-methyltransferase TrmB [Clostridium algidicarnis]|uniref:tRNA (guanine-N(7)-)-methyltransferase n=1 Tax=Clostridium algidicarnis TaxID=37659 RepID=A0ABS6C017_9CLOT|nr:tRNA (guanosine(46)-N7)-methyltransferase TrmB [Clostridium algidicarnis]MBU3218824.1 tRNA (guanosine(46)-N7)-methyltransferase TrmB [Clostridium algidicarnis]MCB2286046.1 tRNA (guanosine(46)-N7)-methyltransferase TrmB [Clostridium algidicarnis]
MRLRKKWWARPELEQSKEVVTEPSLLKGKWKEEFNNSNPIYLELGCGKGRFISTQAQANKDINFIGIDLKDEVLVYALRKVNEVEREVDNIRLIPLEIAFIEEVFDKNEIDRIYINFCNPWPKLSHNKRRLTHSRFLERYKTFLQPESEIWFKSDDKDLFNDSLEYFNESGFELLYHTYDLHNSDFKENIMTEYEEKFRSKGMKIMFLRAKLK